MQNNMYKTMMCKFFEQNNMCKQGENCNYAHSFNELRKRDNEEGRGYNNYNNRPYNNNFNKGNYQNNNNNNSYYKTSICKFWEQGSCKFEDNCKYAHGENDLKKNY